MEQFLQRVQLAMIEQGWSAEAAATQINVDPAHLLELKDEGMSPSDVAVEAERQYQFQHFKSG